jgi:hypothetical protein
LRETKDTNIELQKQINVLEQTAKNIQNSENGQNFLSQNNRYTAKNNMNGPVTSFGMIKIKNPQT